MLIDGVVKDNPVPNAVPPEELEYHETVEEEVAERVTVPVPHLELLFDTGAAGADFITAWTDALELIQFPEIASA